MTGSSPLPSAGATPRVLPSGTVTFLFTDIEGSTRLLHDLGPEGYAAALAKHRAVIRDAIAVHGGSEVDTQGDAFFVAFPTAAAAVGAAVAGRDALAASGPIRVRMGLHTGTPHLTDEGYVGVDVHLAARIGACAHGGQVVVSATTASAAPGVQLRDLGEHRLKDFDLAVPLYQVGDETFPPLKTISNTNLPRPVSALVGREEETRAVVELVEQGARLVTLVGPGGTGKTRLAIAAATELVAAFPAGVFWVPLATVRNHLLVLPEVARVLGGREDLATHISTRQMLLVLDNFEQVVDAAPGLAALVERCPRLVVITTSRERLRVAGEAAYDVAPLHADAAVELFCARAGVSADADVDELCHALDQLPLAIELAAARAGVMSPRQLLDRLSRRLDLLKGGRDADPRQQTLRATIQWSYDLVEDTARTLFARLAVFRGGCTLEAADTLADADLDDLQSLVDKSLLRSDGGRFWMLETVREFAYERLTTASDCDAVVRRHAAYYLELVESLEPRLRKQSAKSELDLAEAELANVAAAIGRLLERGETQLALRIAAAAWWVWSWRGYVAEGRERLRAVLAADAAPTEARAGALVGAADLALDSGDYVVGRRLLTEAQTIYRGLPESWRSVYTNFLHAMFELNTDDPRSAEPHFLRALEGFQRLDDRPTCRDVRRRIAWMYQLAGDVQRSTDIHMENLADARSDGDRYTEATELSVLAGRAIDAGEWKEALDLAADALQLHVDLGARYDVIVDLHRFARVLARTGSLEDAVVLVGVVQEQFRQRGAVTEWVAAELQEITAMAEQVVLPAELEAARNRGAHLTLDEGVQLAVSHLHGDG